MMTCQELITDFLSDYVDGELPDEVAKEFARHLSVCDACVAYVENYRRTVALAKEAGKSASCCGTPHAAPAVPEDLVKAILKLRPQGQVAPHSTGDKSSRPPRCC